MAQPRPLRGEVYFLQPRKTGGDPINLGNPVQEEENALSDPETLLFEIFCRKTAQSQSDEITTLEIEPKILETKAATGFGCQAVPICLSYGLVLFFGHKKNYPA